jgi:dienelactone hydrolase
MDSARAAMLYVSNRPEDHPQADFAAQIAATARTDSIFAARSGGVMTFRKVTYPSAADGMAIPAHVFTPLAPPGPRRRAAIVWAPGALHGFVNEGYLPFVMDAVRQGYVVVIPAYRGSMGYGAAHYNAIDYGGKELDDVASAVDYLRTLGSVDPDRIGLLGHSHGGYITTLLLFRGRTPFRVGVASAPVTNLVFRLASAGPRYERQFATQAGLRGLPFENRAEYIRRSPYYGVDSLRVPLFVYVATNDEDVTFAESRPLIDALQARKPGLAETKVYVDPPPGPFSGGHSFAARVNPQTLERDDTPEQADAWARTWAFFARTLRPDAPPDAPRAAPGRSPAAALSATQRVPRPRAWNPGAWQGLASPAGPSMIARLGESRRANEACGSRRCAVLGVR